MHAAPPPRFRYQAPSELDAATRLLAGNGARLLAGGQSLIAALRAGQVESELLIDLRRIPSLQQIAVTPDDIVLGAMATLNAVLSSTAVAAMPVLDRVLRQVANHTVRNRSTIGGNLAWADPNGEVALLAVALDGTVTTTHRQVAAGTLFVGPQQTCLEADEILTALVLPRPPGLRAAFQELTLRPSGGRSIVSALATAVDGIPHRLAIGGVGPTTLRIELGNGGGTPGDMLASALAAAMPLPDPLYSAGYRRSVAAVLAHRVMEELHA